RRGCEAAGNRDRPPRHGRGLGEGGSSTGPGSAGRRGDGWGRSPRSRRNRAEVGSGRGHQVAESFDKISHEWLLAHVPMDRQVLGRWLKAGFLEEQAWFATTEGTPQGGIVSPALANWTLDGLQRPLADHFARTPKQQRMNKVHLVRSADDF